MVRISITRNDIEEKCGPELTQKLEKLTQCERENEQISLFQSDCFSPKPKNKGVCENYGNRDFLALVSDQSVNSVNYRSDLTLKDFLGYNGDATDDTLAP